MTPEEAKALPVGAEVWVRCRVGERDVEATDGRFVGVAVAEWPHARDIRLSVDAPPPVPVPDVAHSGFGTGDIVMVNGMGLYAVSRVGCMLAGSTASWVDSDGLELVCSAHDRRDKT
jgi:hypothetical protein